MCAVLNVCNAQDNCPNVANPGNPNQADADGDGLGDACDSYDCSDEITSPFNPNPLTHTGAASSFTNINFPSGTEDAIFTDFYHLKRWKVIWLHHREAVGLLGKGNDKCFGQSPQSIGGIRQQ